MYTINLEAYEDTWEYNEGGEIFRIYLKIVPKDNIDSYGLCLVGDYFYSKNNVILDTYTASNVPEIYNDFTIKNLLITQIPINYICVFTTSSVRKEYTAGKLNYYPPIRFAGY